MFMLSFLGLSLLLALTLLPSADLPDGPAFPMSDKVAHFLAFGLVSTAITYDIARYRGQLTPMIWIITGVALTALGIGIEFLQDAMGKGRSADSMDALADAAGVFLLPLALWPLIKRSVDLYVFHMVPSRLSGDTVTKVQKLYLDSFPEEERRQWEDLSMRVNSDNEPLNLLIIKAKGRFAGFITWWRLGKGLRYVEHFAIDPALRGGGTGARAIKEFAIQESTPVILEVEPEGSGEMALRRIGFYRRCGFIDHPEFSYVQPPYATGLPSVPLTLMTSGNKTPDLEDATRQLHKKVYGSD